MGPLVLITGPRQANADLLVRITARENLGLVVGGSFSLFLSLLSVVVNALFFSFFLLRVAGSGTTAGQAYGQGEPWLASWVRRYNLQRCSLAFLWPAPVPDHS